MGVKPLSVVLVVVTAFVVTGLARADAPLAGARLLTGSHGQLFCINRSDIEALLRSEIAHVPRGTRPDTCGFVAAKSLVAATADRPPSGRLMHVVRARANSTFRAIDGFIYSVGLDPYPVPRNGFDATTPFVD